MGLFIATQQMYSGPACKLPERLDCTITIQCTAVIEMKRGVYTRPSVLCEATPIDNLYYLCDTRLEHNLGTSPPMKSEIAYISDFIGGLVPRLIRAYPNSVINYVGLSIR